MKKITFACLSDFATDAAHTYEAEKTTQKWGWYHQSPPHPPKKERRLAAGDYFGFPKNKCGVVLEDSYPVCKYMDMKWLPKEETHQTSSPKIIYILAVCVSN